MQRHELLTALLKPADLLLSAQLSLLSRAGLLQPLQDGAYQAAGRLLRTNFRQLHGLEVHGLDRLPAGGLIFASNHQSWLDVQVLACSVPRRVHFMAKEEFRRWPIMRQLVELSRSFYVDRSGNDHTGFTQALGWLAADEAVALYPEGTIPGEEDLARSKVEQATALLRGRTGAVRLAIASGKPIVPVGVTGSSAAFPPEMFPRLEMLPLPRRERITLRFGDPISYTSYGGQVPPAGELRRLTDELMGRIADLVDHHRQWVPQARIPPALLRTEPGDERRMGVLLLHGFGSSTKSVQGLVPVLERHGIPWRMPVLSGHGTVFTDLTGTTAQDWVDDATRALEDLMAQVERVVVVGLSMGALIGLELARRQPQQIAGVVALAPALRFASALAPLAGMVSRFVRYWPSPNPYRDAACATQDTGYERFATDSFASLLRFASEVESRLAEVSVPLCIAHSRRDPVAEPRGAQLLLDRVASEQKELIWFHRSGHEMLLDLEAPAVTAIVEEFLLQRRRALRTL